MHAIIVNAWLKVKNLQIIRKECYAYAYNNKFSHIQTKQKKQATYGCGKIHFKSNLTAFPFHLQKQ